MDRPISPIEVEQHLARLSEALEERTSALERIEAALADAEFAYKRAYLIAYERSGESSVAAREREAERACLDEWAELRVVQADERVTKEKLRTLRTQLDAYRSINSNLRSQT